MLLVIADAGGQLCSQPVVKSYIESFYTLTFQVELVVTKIHVIHFAVSCRCPCDTRHCSYAVTCAV